MSVRSLNINILRAVSEVVGGRKSNKWTTLLPRLNNSGLGRGTNAPARKRDTVLTNPATPPTEV